MRGDHGALKTILRGVRRVAASSLREEVRADTDGLESAQQTGDSGRIVATRKLRRKDFFSPQSSSTRISGN